MATGTISSAGIILGTRTVRESDRIVTILTAESGKLTAVVRGALRSKRRFMSGIDILDAGDFLLRSPARPGSLFAVEQLTNRRIWPALRESILKCSLAFWCVEATELVSPEDDHDSRLYYQPLIAVLTQLSASKSSSECFALAINFNMRVLHLAGLDPLAHHSVADVQSAQWWLQMREHGGALPPPAQECISESIIELNRFWEGELGLVLKTKPELLRTVAQWQEKQ